MDMTDDNTEKVLGAATVKRQTSAEEQHAAICSIAKSLRESLDWRIHQDRQLYFTVSKAIGEIYDVGVWIKCAVLVQLAVNTILIALLVIH